MDWLLENWFSIVIFVLFIFMHIFGHDGHGGHGGDEIENDEAQARGAKTGSGRHQH